MIKLAHIIEEEIGKIEDRGITSANLDYIYKMIDIYKDIKTIEGMDSFSEISIEHDNEHKDDKTDIMAKLSDIMRNEGMSPSEISNILHI